MIWVGWRQQRTETLIAAAMLVLLAAVAIPVGLHMASVYTHEGLAACAGNAQPGSCIVSLPSFLMRFNGIDILFTWSTILPAVAGLLFAAPFVLDLDNGTYRLFWTQSITRRRWIVTKLTLGATASVVAAACLVALAGWSRAPLDHLNGRMNTNAYDAEGLVPIAYALFVLGVAVAIGALWRRTVPALLVSFVVYVIGRAFVDSWLRQRLLTPVKTIWRPAVSNGPNLNQAMVINQFLSTKNGTELQSVPQLCTRGSGGGVFGQHTATCASPRPTSLHAYMTAIYQPANRFWELQGVEFGIVAGIGVALILLAGWWTHHRVA